MKLKIKDNAIILSIYDLLIMLIIMLGILAITVIWIWYEYNNHLIEKEIYRLN